MKPFRAKKRFATRDLGHASAAIGMHHHFGHGRIAREARELAEAARGEQRCNRIEIRRSPVKKVNQKVRVNVDAMPLHPGEQRALRR